jgi:hypothetical protein
MSARIAAVRELSLIAARAVALSTGGRRNGGRSGLTRDSARPSSCVEIGTQPAN